MDNFDEVILCTIPRTGSTLIYRILRYIFKDKNIKKSHSFEKYFDHKGPFVMTYRDPIDILCSFWRIDAKQGKWENNEISDLEAVRLCARVLFEYSRFNDFVLKQIVLDDNSRNLLFLRYEDFWDNYDIIYDKLSSFFDIEISSDKRKELTDKCSMKSVLEIQKKYKDFSEVDKETAIHGDHIGLAKPYKWWDENKDKISPSAVNYVIYKLNYLRFIYNYRVISPDDYVQVLFRREATERMNIVKSGRFIYVDDRLEEGDEKS